MRSDRRLILPLFVVAALGIYFFLAPRFPRDQVVEIVLGDAAPKVRSVRIAYEDTKGDWTSEIELNFEHEPAPRVVHHETRMPDGDYKMAIDVSGTDGGTHVERRVTLAGGGSTSVDVSEAVLAELRTGADR